MKNFFVAEKGVISEPHEKLCCLKALSEHFSKTCVCTLDRGFDGNEYYKYFLRNNEKFVIWAKKNRNVIYNGKTQNIMEIENVTKGTTGWILWIRRERKQNARSVSFR